MKAGANARRMPSQRKPQSRQNEVRFGGWHHRFLRESTNENGPFAGVVRRLYTWDRHKSPSGGATKRRTEKSRVLGLTAFAVVWYNTPTNT